MSSTTPDRIERQVRLDVTLDRVWAALTDADQFSAWSGMVFDGPFQQGTALGARLTAAALATDHEHHEAVPVRWHVDRIDPKRLFRFQWHPFPVDASVDYSKEPMNVITVTFDDEDGAVVLTVVEAGFLRIPVERRQQAYDGNSQGWDIQLRNLAEYLAR